MDKKATFRITVKFIASIIVGGILALLLLTQNSIGDNQIIKDLENLLYNHTIVVNLIMMFLFLVPAAILHYVGKKEYSAMMSSDEDDIDDATRKKAGYLDSAMSLLGVFIAMNFMQYGMLYNKTTADSSTMLVLFMLGILFTAMLQVSTVKHIQKFDNRLKGDPTKGSFNKEFVDSMDEAEQLRVFKAGYRSFQAIKTITQMIVVITIFMNIIFKTGGFAVFISSLFMLVQIVTFAYYEKQAV
jgi:hypothetical protein